MVGTPAGQLYGSDLNPSNVLHISTASLSASRTFLPFKYASDKPEGKYHC